MICKACGSRVQDGSKICDVCGAVLNDERDYDYESIDFGIADMVEAEAGPEPNFEVPDFGVDERDTSDADMDLRLPDFEVPDLETVVPADEDEFAQKAPDFEAPVFDDEDGASFAPGSAPSVPARSSAAPVRAVRYSFGGLRSMIAGREPGGRRRLVAIVCVVVAMGVGAVFAYSRLSARAAAVEQVSAQERKAAEQYEATQPASTIQAEPVQRLRKYDIVVPVEAEGLNGAGSRIPVQVTGTVADGTEYNVSSYLSVEGTGIKLSQGTYELRVIASPICGNGVMYHVPGDVVSIVILGDGTCMRNPDTPIVFSVVEALDMTEEQISASLQYVFDDPERTEMAEALGNSARKRRDDAVEARNKQLQAEEQKRQAEEQKRQAEEEKQRQAEEKRRQAEAAAQEAEARRQAEEEARQQQQEQEAQQAQAVAEGMLTADEDTFASSDSGGSQTDSEEEDKDEDKESDEVVEETNQEEDAS